jgi:LuxR family transcriptional regulator, maltose regulon positive regulatory protein
VRDLGQVTGSRLLEYFCPLAEASLALERQEEELVMGLLREMLRLSRASGGLNIGFILGPLGRASLYAKALEAGIEVEYVQALIRRSGLTAPDPVSAPDHWPWPVKVYTLGSCSVIKDGEPLRFSGKAQRKPLDLLMALLALGGREVPQAKLADALWPESEGDAAYRALITTVQRLRRLLGHPEAIVVTEGTLSLDPRYAWVDSWAFERLFKDAEAASERGEGPKAQALCEQALSLYHGPFLQKSDAAWAVTVRERLRARYLHHLLTLGQAWERADRAHAAAGLYLRGIEADELIEAFYQALIRCYQELSREGEARAVYERCRKVLAAALGTSPSSATQRLLS